MPSIRSAIIALCVFLLTIISGSQGFEARAVQGPPADATRRERQLLKVQQLLESGNLVEARGELARALKEFPEDAVLYNLLGVVDAQESNYRAAESNFNQAVARAPKFTGAYLNLGRLYQEHAGRDPAAIEKALSVYGKILQYLPDHREAVYQSAVLFQLRGDFKISLDHLARLPGEYRERPPALAVRCADHVGLGQNAQADQTAEQLMKTARLAEADILSILPTLKAHGRDDLEARLLENLVERQLSSANTLSQLGLLYEQQGRLDAAHTTLEKVAAAKPDSAQVLIDLARVAHKRGAHREALGYLAHARDLEPRRADVHFFFGMVCVDLNLGGEAHQSLTQAVNLEPENAYYNYALGAVSVHRRDPGEALPFFQKYARLKPDDPRGRLALGAAYFHSGNFDAAREELREAVKRSETAAGAHYFLALLAKRQENLSEALRELTVALELNPRYADAHAESGLLHLRRKDYQAAEKSLRHALTIDSDHYAANFNLLTLYTRTKDGRETAQARRFAEVKSKRDEMAQQFLRTVEVRPY